MSSPLPPHVRKAPPRKAEPVNKGTLFEYIKFWVPFIISLAGSFAMFMAKISVLETKVDAQAVTIQKLEEKVMGRDALIAKFTACETRHRAAETDIAKLEVKVDRHIESASDGR